MINNKKICEKIYSSDDISRMPLEKECNRIFRKWDMIYYLYIIFNVFVVWHTNGPQYKNAFIFDEKAKTYPESGTHVKIKNYIKIIHFMNWKHNQNYSYYEKLKLLIWLSTLTTTALWWLTSINYTKHLIIYCLLINKVLNFNLHLSIVKRLFGAIQFNIQILNAKSINNLIINYTFCNNNFKSYKIPSNI